MVTIKDVAKEANVSIATVSNVINNTNYVSPELTEKVNQAIKKLNYKPNEVARGLKTKRSKTIALICSDIANPFYAPLMKGAEKILSEKNYSLIICNTDENVEKETEYIDVIMQKNVDGLIIAPTGENLNIFKQLNSNHIPYVCVDRKINNLKSDIVSSDNIDGAYQLTKHLLKLGHRRIGILMDKIQTSNERLSGYKKALKEYKIDFQKELVMFGRYNIKGGTKAANKLLQLENKPTAIFSTMNLMTIGAMKAILENGYKCPEDISLAGFDDFEWASVFKPHLTTVAQFPNKIGQEASQILIKRIEDPQREYQEIKVATQLIIRNSTRKI